MGYSCLIDLCTALHVDLLNIYNIFVSSEFENLTFLILVFYSLKHENQFHHCNNKFTSLVFTQN